MRTHQQLFREGRPPASTPGGLAPDYSASDARQIIASNHEFEVGTRSSRFNAT
jgi:hypothetical protein